MLHGSLQGVTSLDWWTYSNSVLNTLNFLVLTAAISPTMLDFVELASFSNRPSMNSLRARMLDAAKWETAICQTQEDGTSYHREQKVLPIKDC